MCLPHIAIPPAARQALDAEAHGTGEVVAHINEESSGFDFFNASGLQRPRYADRRLHLASMMPSGPLAATAAFQFPAG